MLADPNPPPSASLTGRKSPRPLFSEVATQIAVFMISMAVMLLLALRANGSFDLITRQENGLIFWWILAIGIALGLLPRRLPGRATTAALGFLFAYGLWSGLSAAWSESAERSVAEAARIFDYLGLVLVIFCTLDRKTWRAAAMGWAAAAMTVCALSFASRMAPSAFPPNNAGTVFDLARLSYPFGYWNAVGAWAAMSVAVALAWSANDRRLVPRVLALACVPLATSTAYLTYSRASAAGIAAAAIAVLAFSRNRWTALIHTAVAATTSLLVIDAIRKAPQVANGTGTAGTRTVVLTLAAAVLLSAAAAAATQIAKIDRFRLPRRAALGLGATLAAAVVALGAAFGPGFATRTWNQFQHPLVVQTGDPAARLTSLSGSRYQLWKAALSAFDQFTTHGTGAGTFEFWWNRHATEDEFVMNAHSLWLETMAELGLPGLLLVLGFVGAAVAAGIQALRRSQRSSGVAACVAAIAALCVFLVQASVDWMWQSTAVTALALSGVAIASVRTSGRLPRWRWAVRGLLAVTVALVGAVQVPGMLGTAEVQASQKAVRGQDGATALAWANQAISAEPWAASPYLQHGLVLESLGRFREAAADLRRATSREPTNFELWVVRSRIDAERGRPAAAVLDYRRAKQLRPYSVVLNRS